MNNYEIFLTLLQREIYPNRATSRINQYDVDLQKIYQLGQMHHVLPIIHAQINCHKNEFGFRNLNLKQWRNQSINMVLMQERASSNFLELYQNLKKIGIFALVVKGITLRELYPNPNYRFSSDEDIWIKKEHAKQCEDFLISQGYRKESYSSEDTISFTHMETFFHLEVHLMPFSILGPHKQLNQLFIHCFNDFKKICIQKAEICTLNDTDHYIYLIAHAYQHFMSSGVGIRQLMDISLFQQRFNYSICFEHVEDSLSSYGLLEFYEVIRDFIEVYIEGDIFDAFHNTLEMQDLLVDIISGGVFGKNSAARISGSNIIYAQLNGATSFGQKIKQSLFLSQNLLSHKYPWVNKTKFFLPIAWILRVYHFLSRNRFDFKIFFQSFQLGKERLLLAKKYHFIDDD